MAVTTDIQEMQPASADSLDGGVGSDNASVADGAVDMYRADAAVGSKDTPGVPEMVVYQVSKRFVDNEDSASDEATSIVYYALGIGHHTGIIDCFEERLRCSMPVMEGVLSAIPRSSRLATKLRTAYEREEAYIDKYDLQPLTSDIDAALGTEDPYRDLPLDELPAPRGLLAGDADVWLSEFRILLDRMMADWDASLIIRRRG